MNNQKDYDDALKDWFDKNTPEVPLIVSQKVNETLESIPKEIPNRNLWKRVGLSAATVVMCFTLVTGLAFMSPTLTKALHEIPVIGSLFQSLMGDPGLKEASKQGLSTPMNETVTDQGISFSIKEVLYDGTRISVAYTYRAEENIDRGAAIIDWKFGIDGKRFNFGYGMGGSEQAIDDYQHAGVIDITTNKTLPDEFILDIMIGKIGEIKGDWTFHIPITKQKTGIVTKEFQSNPTKTYNNHTITVNKITFTPSVTEVSLDWIQSKDSTEHFHAEFQVWDDKGNMLPPLGTHGDGDPKGDQWVTHYKIKLVPIYGQPKYLLVKPIDVKMKRTDSSEKGESQSKKTYYLQPPTEAQTISKDLNGSYPIILEQGEVGHLKIPQVEFLSDKTVLHIQADGFNPYRQADSIWLEDEEGNQYHELDRPIRVQEIKNGYIQEYPPLDSRKEIRIVTVPMEKPQFVEELELQVPLEW